MQGSTRGEMHMSSGARCELIGRSTLGWKADRWIGRCMGMVFTLPSPVMGRAMQTDLRSWPLMVSQISTSYVDTSISIRNAQEIILNQNMLRMVQRIGYLYQ